MFTLCRRSCIYNIHAPLSLKPFLIFDLYLIPGWISAHHIKSSIVCKNLRELYTPMEETMANRTFVDRCLEVG